jgi:N-methylhydantoinase B
VTNVDPTTLAVVRGRLEQTTDEMDTVFERMAFSPVISDAWDRADGIYRPDNGSMIVQGERGLPIFVGTMQHATRAVIDHVQKPRSGDVFMLNDPYLGGTHTPDIQVFVPVVADGRLIAWCGNIAHHSDVGGTNPGTEGYANASIFEEGLRIPIARLYREGAPNEALLELLAANVRVPGQVMGDLAAQLISAQPTR